MDIEKYLNDPEWPEAVDIKFVCDDTSDEQKTERAQDIIDILLPKDYKDKSILDFGTGEGHTSRVFKQKGVQKAFGFDIYNKFIKDDGLNLTTDWEEIEKNAPYDYIIAYDVLDHLERINIAESLYLLYDILSPTGKLFVRYHPFTSRHGGHLYKDINKAYAHLVLNKQEKTKYLKDKPIYTEPYAMPLTIYREAAKVSKFLIESEQNMTSKVEEFFFKSEISERIGKNLGVTTFPLSQMSLQFVDHVLIRSNL
jgi:cyclopropane fatty-acyl-phospholipid synthase-like methyltransferase